MRRRWWWWWWWWRRREKYDYSRMIQSWKGGRGAVYLWLHATVTCNHVTVTCNHGTCNHEKDLVGEEEENSLIVDLERLVGEESPNRSDTREWILEQGVLSILWTCCGLGLCISAMYFGPWRKYLNLTLFLVMGWSVRLRERESVCVCMCACVFLVMGWSVRLRAHPPSPRAGGNAFFLSLYPPALALCLRKATRAQQLSCLCASSPSRDH